MTQNRIANKPQAGSATQHQFLAALYQNSPADLYLELRCIHPATGEVRSLWAQLGKQHELASALKQADELNQNGFGVYFAPCPRKTKQGKAEAAAQVPALWIDIDCDGDA